MAFRQAAGADQHIVHAFGLADLRLTRHGGLVEVFDFVVIAFEALKAGVEMLPPGLILGLGAQTVVVRGLAGAGRALKLREPLASLTQGLVVRALCLGRG